MNKFKVSRQTYGRILARARHCISEALVTGKALRIEGGDYEFRGMGKCGPQGGTPAPQGQGGRGTGRCQGRKSGQGFGRGQGKGRGTGQGRGRQS